MNGLHINNINSTIGQHLIEKLVFDVEWFDKNFSDHPTLISGWGHNYFCSEDGALLTFDLEKPLAHICPLCGKNHNAQRYNDTWRYMYRYSAMMSAVESATLYKIKKEEKYLEHFKRIISFYAEHYDEFEPHAMGPATSGAGKITPQALNEAIFLVKVVVAMEFLKDDLDAEFVEYVSQKMLIPGAYFVDGQKGWINNIPCWINSCVGAVGLYTNTEELIESAFEKEYGLYDQIDRGVTKDFFWFEGSIHYNFFTIESFMNLLHVCKLHGKEIPQKYKDIIYNMMLSPCKMSFSNSLLPNPNDGWPNLNLKTYSYLYEMAANIFESEELYTLLANIYKKELPMMKLPMSGPICADEHTLEWLLYSIDNNTEEKSKIWDTSTNFFGTNYATLRNENCEVFMKYGHCTTSHAHNDKMNLEVTAFGKVITRDLSNCGYGARLCDEFYRLSVAHNTVIMNGKCHTSTILGECLEYDGKILQAKTTNAYEGVDFDRRIVVGENGFEDTFAVTSKEEGVIDFVFHLEGKCTSELNTVPGDLIYKENGYQHVLNVEKIVLDSNELTLNWEFIDGITGVQTINVEGVEAFICDTYDNPVIKFRRSIILRAKSTAHTFNQKIEFSK